MDWGIIVSSSYSEYVVLAVSDVELPFKYISSVMLSISDISLTLLLKLTLLDQVKVWIITTT